MLPTRKNFSSRNILVALAVLVGVLSSTVAIAECLPGQMQEANLAYQSAQEFLAAQQWDQAIARMQSIVDVCPEHIEAQRGIGDAFMGKKMYPQAVPYFQKVIGLRGNNAEAGDYANLAKAYAKQKQYKEARAEYMAAAELAPDDCGVLINLGVMHYAAKYYGESVTVLEHALEVCPQYSDKVLPQLTNSAEKAAAQQKANGNNDRAAYYTGLAQEYGGQAEIGRAHV